MKQIDYFDTLYPLHPTSPLSPSSPLHPLHPSNPFNPSRSRQDISTGDDWDAPLEVQTADSNDCCCLPANHCQDLDDYGNQNVAGETVSGVPEDTPLRPRGAEKSWYYSDIKEQEVPPSRPIGRDDSFAGCDAVADAIDNFFSSIGSFLKWFWTADI